MTLVLGRLDLRQLVVSASQGKCGAVRARLHLAAVGARMVGGLQAIGAAKLISFLALPTYAAFFLVNALR